MIVTSTSSPLAGFAGFAEDARTALQASPDYFIVWYTAKSLALVGVAVAFAFYIGRTTARR